MSLIERVLPADRAAKLLASGLCFATANLALKLFTHAVWGEYGGWDFRAGALVGFFGAILVGMVLAVPALVAESGRALTLALAILALTYDAFAYSTYADTGHLPTASTLFGYAASADVAFVVRGVGLGALASLGYGLGVARLEPRLQTRMASFGTRVADFATIVLFALFGLGTLIAGSGPVYYGVIHPLVHLAAGRIQERPDPLPETANAPHTHHHEHARRHEHGFVPEESAEPFPADGIPRPAESMRMQYQGLLGAEKFLPIEDTAYPYCRRESPPTPLTKPRDVVVVDLSGASRATFDETLATAGPAEREALSFARVYAVSLEPEAGRRSLLTGVPPTVSARFVPDVPDLPPAAYLPRYPSLPASLAKHGVRSAYFGPDPGVTGTARIELATLGFDTLSYSPVDGSGAVDLETLGRARAYLDAAASGPRFTFVELRSAREKTPDPRVIAALEELIRAHPEASFVLTSDSVRGGAETPSAAELAVPFVILADDLPEEEGLSRRLGSTYDLPLTVLGLFGGENRFCHQGRDLLALEPPFPARRVVLSQIGEDGFVLTEARRGGEEFLRWNIDGSNPMGAETPVELFDLSVDPSRKSDLFSRTDPDWPQLDELWKSHLAIGVYLLRTDRFVPPEEGPKPERTRLARGESVPFTKVERVPAATGNYLVPVTVFDRGDELGAVLASASPKSTVVLDVRSRSFDDHEALESWLGGHADLVDGLLFDEVAMAVAHAERSKRAVGVWHEPTMGDRGSLFAQLSRGGIDFMLMPLATDSAVRRARMRGLEVWVPKMGAEKLADAKPDVVLE